MVLISFNEVRRTMIYPLLLMFFSIYSSFVLKKSGSIFGEMDMSSIPDSLYNHNSIYWVYLECFSRSFREILNGQNVY